MSAPNITKPLYDAVLAAPDVTALLPIYLGSRAVFTRRPIPNDSPYPCIVISQDITVTDEDGINDYRTLIMRDMLVFGSNERPENLRIVNQIAFLLYNLFHRRRHVITIPNWAVVDIIANGPIQTAIVDQIGGRAVPLLVKVAQSRGAVAPVVVIPSHLLLSDGSDLLLADGSGVLELA